MAGGQIRGAVDLAEIAGVIRRITYNAYRAALSSQAPDVAALYGWMKTLNVGSLVVETTTIHHSLGKSNIDAVGYLERIAQEPISLGEGVEPWDEVAEGRPHPTEKVYYIRTLDGREARWDNADFIAAPTELLASNF